MLIANDRGCARHVPALRRLAGELRRAAFATFMVGVLTISDQQLPDVAARLSMQEDLLARRIASARLWLSRSTLQNRRAPGGAAPAALLSAVLFIAHRGSFDDTAPTCGRSCRLRAAVKIALLPDNAANPEEGAVNVARAAVRFLRLAGSVWRRAA